MMYYYTVHFDCTTKHGDINIYIPDLNILKCPYLVVFVFARRKCRYGITGTLLCYSTAKQLVQANPPGGRTSTP